MAAAPGKRTIDLIGDHAHDRVGLNSAGFLAAKIDFLAQRILFAKVFTRQSFVDGDNERRAC